MADTEQTSLYFPKLDDVVNGSDSLVTTTLLQEEVSIDISNLVAIVVGSDVVQTHVMAFVTVGTPSMEATITSFIWPCEGTRR